MNIPKNTKFTLKRIIENLDNIPNNGFGEKPKPMTPEDKKKLMEMASMFENYGKVLQNEEAILNSAKSVSELCELAHTYAVNECGDVFQKNIIDKDMKDLKRRVLEYGKVAKECYSRMQQLGVAHNDIGHILGRYYDLKSQPQIQSEVVNKCGKCGDNITDSGSNGMCSSCAQEYDARTVNETSKKK